MALSSTQWELPAQCALSSPRPCSKDLGARKRWAIRSASRLHVSSFCSKRTRILSPSKGSKVLPRATSSRLLGLSSSTVRACHRQGQAHNTRSFTCVGVMERKWWGPARAPTEARRPGCCCSVPQASKDRPRLAPRAQSPLHSAPRTECVECQSQIREHYRKQRYLIGSKGIGELFPIGSEPVS